VLAPKYANKIGKTCEGYLIRYTMEGTMVQARSLLADDGSAIDTAEVVSIVEFDRRVALKNQPTAADRLASLKRKFELRLNMEFPTPGPASGSEADVQAWLATLPFPQRVALLKSQKDWEKSQANNPGPGFRAQGQ